MIFYLQQKRERQEKGMERMTRSRRTKMSRSRDRDEDDGEKEEDEALEAYDEL